jgi:HSP20 family protein
MSDMSVEKVPSAADRSLPVFAEFDDIADKIRERAFSIFRERGLDEGHALDDWLAAERQVCWPASELEEEDDKYTVKVALAGFESDEISLTATPTEIIVRAEHESRSKKDDEESVTHWSEFRSNKVFRRFDLPAEIDVDAVKANYKDGMLRIKAPKLPTAKKKAGKVDISSAA